MQQELSIDVSKVYLLQKQLEDLMADTMRDEQEIDNAEAKDQLRISREMIQKLVNKLKIQTGKELSNEMRDMPQGFKQRR